MRKISLGRDKDLLKKTKEFFIKNFSEYIYLILGP